MSELIDKLERASKGAAQPLGFRGAASRERIAPILLIAAVDSGDPGQAEAAAQGGVDAAIIDPAVDGAAALNGVAFGVRLDVAQAADPDGADFQVFASDDTTLAALAGDDRTIVMDVSPDLDDHLLRALDSLPVDAFLVRLNDEGALTVRQLMRLGRVRNATSRWLLAQVAALPSKEEAELLRDAGVAAIVVSAGGLTADAIRETREMLVDIPRESARKKRRDQAAVSLPRPARGTASAPPPPEPDDDDDDWDDE